MVIYTVPCRSHEIIRQNLEQGHVLELRSVHSTSGRVEREGSVRLSGHVCTPQDQRNLINLQKVSEVICKVKGQIHKQNSKNQSENNQN